MTCSLDDAKDDGFTALHLAALNNHRAVAELLLESVSGRVGVGVGVGVGGRRVGVRVVLGEWKCEERPSGRRGVELGEWEWE